MGARIKRSILSECLMSIGLMTLVVAVNSPLQAQEVIVPELSVDGLQGASHFLGKCASCHGPYAGGTDKGPPLVHRLYHPGHHTDETFWRAIRSGSPQHHWSFGNMKPVEGVEDQHVPMIIQFVREIQKANEIY